MEILKVSLTPQESENFFHNALCNMMSIGGYGLVFDYEKEDYTKARKSLQKKSETGEFKSVCGICREDVWMEILRIGGKLKVIDEENDGEYTREITLKDVHERVQKTPVRHLMDAINENDDAETADVITIHGYVNQITV